MCKDSNLMVSILLKTSQQQVGFILLRTLCQWSTPTRSVQVMLSY